MVRHMARYDDDYDCYSEELVDSNSRTKLNVNDFQSFTNNAGKAINNVLKVGFVSDIKQLLSNSELKRIANFGVVALEAFGPYVDKPTILNGGRAFFRLAQNVIDQAEIWPDEYFEERGWVKPFSNMFTFMILRMLVGQSHTVIKTANEDSFIKLVERDGVKYGWVFDKKGKSVREIYVEERNVEKAQASIKRMFWEAYGNQSLVMRRNNVISIDDSSGIVFEIDDAFNPLPSKMATEHSAYLRRCLDAGVRRSILLFGPPGTGKSTMARTLVKNLGLKSVRIRVEDIEQLNQTHLSETINMFEPDAIILDDFDRARAQASLLETLEFFRRHVKLVIASANNKHDLDEAILRPGRFDELILVNEMDEAIVKNILGEYVDGFEDVKSWPVAFIEEYVKRRMFLDKSQAINSMRELAHRVERLSRYSEGWVNISSEAPSDEAGEPEGKVAKDTSKKSKKRRKGKKHKKLTSDKETAQTAFATMKKGELIAEEPVSSGKN